MTKKTIKPDMEGNQTVGEVISGHDLESVRQTESSEPAVRPPKQGNIIIGTLNLITGPIKGLVDPVHKVCYEPIKSHYERKYRTQFPKHHSKVFIFDMILLGILGGLVVFGIFAKYIWPLFPQPDIVTITPITPETIVSGELTDFALSYHNDSEQPLADVRIELKMPNGFVPENGGLEFERINGNHVWTTEIGTMPANDREEISFSGHLYAPIGSRPAMTVTMSFWRAGDTEPKRVSHDISWLVEESLFHLAIRPDEKPVRGQQMTIAIPYANLDSRPIDAVIRMLPPDDFMITGSEPTRSGSNEWNLGTLDPGEKGNVTLYGYFRSGTAKPAVPSFTVSAHILEGGERYTIQELKQSIESMSGGFEVEQSVDKPAGAMSISPGDELKITIRYRNAGLKPINDVTIRLETDTKLFADGTVTVWNRHNLPELESLQPGASGAMTFETKLKDDMTGLIGENDDRIELNLRTTAEYFLDGSPTRPVLAESASHSLPVSGKLDLQAGALYWTKDGDQVGTGPIPPKAGETTKYRVIVSIGNALNRTTETVFEANLPTGVEWTGRYSVTAGKPPTFLTAERRLIWNIGEMSAGGALQETGASFEIALTPEEGSEAELDTVLMTGLKVCGRDSFTDVKICANLNEVTNKLKYQR